MKPLIFGIISLVFFVGCEKPVTEVDIARINAEQYLSERLNRELAGKGSIVEYRHSDLYIFKPLDETKIPKEDTTNNDNEVVAAMKEMRSFFDSYDGISVGLSINGCDCNAIRAVIANNEKYREYETGAKEYLMITYVTCRDTKGLVELERGLCFIFSEDINIIGVYNIEEESDDYINLRVFGQKEGHFFGAVESEYKQLKGEYDSYVKFIKDPRIGIEGGYYLVNELNLLFGYQRFEVTEDKEETIKNCLKKLNMFDDSRELRNKASFKVKSY